jgi:heme/copper-type cytochrome/quinol oxidase subunit 3
MSSLTMVLAHHALSWRQRGCGTWIFATAALGSVFLGGQVFEFTEFITIYGPELSTNPAASAFYVLTGFHGAARVHRHHHAALTVGYLASSGQGQARSTG